jgi:hypothetical protein
MGTTIPAYWDGGVCLLYNLMNRQPALRGEIASVGAWRRRDDEMKGRVNTECSVRFHNAGALASEEIVVLS